MLGVEIGTGQSAAVCAVSGRGRHLAGAGVTHFVISPVEFLLLSVYYHNDMYDLWLVQAVPPSSDSFDSRKKLPADWCGLRDEVLSAKVPE